ncbi:NAD(P)/FAD-dependent oxidoreductase [Intestinibacter bartlettii]|uniref:NAD(P)/FAD-dependent oxidoreductase n=2 Tax=Intestinibacter bartlettii TaxID=261299 RepID=UPI002912C4F8|nr:NAD(P)/FAD-dependent oxidoreductase [Intestinibacter bartlettii]MDU6472184.1 NAD(P)/FAD-dependent oxidoreductase [Intestinibacter bartlettii]
MAYHGNLQKIRNGKRTFAITPHIPGGFIKSEGLIKIGEVAKKYGGVLKITSGQRILITNLQEEDLPAIWEELGMKPAVVTQNSLKNVELCPANFCKRSKYPTIGIGMRLSRKFQGMELPCRTKIGVAGCRNACGSVYAKDIGVLVDFDKMFFVTAGGSAGFHPRPSDIITRGLTEDEAFALVETILEYYNEYAMAGEKLGDFIDRISIDKFRDDVLEIAKLEKNLESKF